jgi:hypothetical protein
MRKFHSIAALCGDGLRPELTALFERLAVDPRSELFVRDDGMIQAGPSPASETSPSNIAPLVKRRVCLIRYAEWFGDGGNRARLTRTTTTI